VTWIKAILAAMLTIIALLVAAIVYINSIDLNRYKAGLVQEIQDASGRAVAIDGGINLSFGLESAFVVDGFRIGNPVWATRDDMIRVGRIEARVPLGPLLFGELRIERLRLYDVDLWLETNGPGAANWFFIDGETSRREKPVPQERVSESRNLLGMLGVGGIDLTGARATYRNAKTGAIHVLELSDGSVDVDGFSKPMQLNGEGTWNGLPLTMRGKVGSLEELVREGGASYKVDLAATVGGVQITANGNVANPNVGGGVNLAIKARADSLQGLKPIMGEVAGRLKHMTLTASATYIRQRFVMGDLRFGLGDSSLIGNLSIDFAPEVPAFDAVFNSPRLDLSALSGRPPGEPAMAGGASVDSPATAGSPPVFSRDVLPWAALTTANGRLSFRGSAVQAAGVTLRGVDLDATLRDGVLSVAPFRGKLAESEIEASATVARVGNGGQFAFMLQAPGLSIGSLMERLDAVRTFEGMAEVRANVSGAGDSFAALFGSLTGEATVSMSYGKFAIDLPGTGAKALPAGPGAIFGMLVDKQADTAAMKCAAIRILARQGVLHSVGSVAESGAAVVVAEGTLDIASERVDLRFSSQSKGPALWLARPVRITGSLSAPAFDAVPGEKPASEGGALSPLAVFFTRLLNSSDNACLEAGRTGRVIGKPGKKSGSKSDQTAE
jgi:uncharacterized protein involved in outer membrane biogenesis